MPGSVADRLRMTYRFERLFTAAPLGESLKVYLSANAAVRAAGIGRGLVLTWLMISADEFGAYQLGLLLVNLLLPILSFGSYEAVARFTPAYEAEGRLWWFLKRALPAVLAGGAMLCAALYWLAEPIGSAVVGRLSAVASSSAVASQASGGSAELVRSATWCLLSLILYHLVQAVLRGRRLFRALSAMELFAGVLFTVAAIIAALQERGTGTFILGVYTASNFVAAAVFGLPSLWYSRSDGPLEGAVERSSALKQLAVYGVWAGWAAFFWQLLLLFPALYLNRMCGAAALANYRAMVIVAQVGHMIPAAVGIAVASAVTARWERKENEVAIGQMNVATKLTMLLMLCVCALIVLLKDAIKLAFRAEYHAGVEAIPLLVIFYLMAGVLALVGIRFTLLRRTDLTWRCWVIGCGVSVVWSVLSIRCDDPAGALILTAQANTAGTTAAMVAAMLLLGRLRFLPDRGTLLLAAAVFVLAAPPVFVLAGVLATVLLASGTSLIFSQSERRFLIERGVRFFQISPPVPDNAQSDNRNGAPGR